MKTVCVYHSSDLDGFMSAAIVKHWFNQRKYCSVCGHSVPSNHAGSTECCGGMTTMDLVEFIGYNYGQSIPDLSEYDKVIMCDISFPRIEMHKLASEKDFTWIDHHISAITENIAFDKQCYEERYKGLRDTKFAACELTWKYFFPYEPMPEIVRLLGRYDCFGHTGTPEEQRVLEFQYGARSYIKNYEDAYKYLLHDISDATDPTGLSMNDRILDAGVSIYEFLCADAKQSYKNGFPIYFGKEEDIEKTKFICINKERFNPINFGIKYHEDGYDGVACFHMNDKMQFCFSLYNDNGQVDCSMIAKQFGGGGHKGAAGFILNKDQFIQFLQENSVV